MAQVWDIRTINGVAPPVPTSFEYSRFTLELDSGTNLAGTMIHNVIAHKVKFVVGVAPMNKTLLRAWLNIVKPDALTITYEDMFDGSIKTGSFYHGDFKISPMWIKSLDNTDVLYNAMSVNLIEN